MPRRGSVLQAATRLRGHARAASARCWTRATDPVRRAPRRLALQPLAGRRQPARPVAAHHAGRVPQAAAGLGDGARPRRAGRGREARTGSGAAPPAWAPTTGAAWCRCRAAAPTPTWCASSTSSTKRFVDGGFSAARGQDRRRLARRRHALRRHRFRPRLADRFGLPAHHQALAARQAAGRGGDGVRRPSRGRVALRVSVDRTPGFERTSVRRALDFYNSEQFLLQGDQAGARSTSPATRSCASGASTC